MWGLLACKLWMLYTRSCKWAPKSNSFQFWLQDRDKTCFLLGEIFSIFTAPLPSGLYGPALKHCLGGFFSHGYGILLHSSQFRKIHSIVAFIHFYNILVLSLSTGGAHHGEPSCPCIWHFLHLFVYLPQKFSFFPLPLVSSAPLPWITTSSKALG